MKKCQLRLDAFLMKGLAALMLTTGIGMLTSCKDDDGLTAGDPNYFTSSRGQFTATLDDNTTLFLLPGATAGTAVLTYDGNNPRHWQSATAATVSVTTYEGNLTLPETVTANGQTFTLTAIGEQAMMGCRTLTSLTLPETVQSFDEGAFAVCTTLASVNIPEGITEIPTGCFGYCPKLNNVTLPSTVKTLGEMAFYGCSGMTSITLNEGLATIGEMAFFDCPNLREITIPATVTTIGNRAFGGRGFINETDYRSKVSAYHVKATTPPTLEGVLYETQDGISPVIYVPAGAVDAYKAAAGWSSLTIEEE